MSNPSQTLPQNGRAFVKAVLSGDTVILRGKPVNGPPPEKTFSLSGISAPRLGTAREPEKEEPFAFASRDFVRRNLLGKEVIYRTEYTTTTNARDFGTLTVQHPVSSETVINRAIVKEGWAKAKQDNRKGQDAKPDDQESLGELELEAQIAKKGIWSEEGGARSAAHSVADARALLDKYKGKPIDAIIEQVRDGSTYRVCLLLPRDENTKTTHQYVTLSLSGVKAPTYRKDVPNVPDLVEEYSEEAKYFVESRLLQRDVKILLEGVSQNDNFVGSVQHPAGNIAEALLAEGLAKVVDWSVTMVTGGSAKLRAAERRAKERKLRLWKSYVGKAKVAGADSDFDAVVTRVWSGDTLTIQSLATGKEKRVQLSSIRAPKPPASKPAEKGSASESVKEFGYDLDAKEFLRNRLIGKKVHVTIDYVKPAEGVYEERECVTVKDNDKNVAEMLIARGLADIIRHRRDDDNRSPHYDQLLIALEKAQTAQKGIHSPKDAPVHRISDASFNAGRAKQFLPYFQRAGTVPGVVDYVAGGSRFRVYVPSQNCALTLVLGGIRAPRAGRPGEMSEPFGQEALEFATRHCMQRDAEFSVEGQDKVGGFIGSLFIKTASGDRKNVAALLLEEGLASVHEYSASQISNSNALWEAEARAKNAKKGVWANWSGDEEQDQKVEEEKGIEQRENGAEIKDVVVSNIEGGGRVWLQIVGSELQKLGRLMSDFANHHDQPASAPIAPFTPRAGEYAAAQFTSDNAWYRARVKKVNPDKTYTVSYIDYGNSETIPASRLRPLDKEFSIQTLPAQSQEAKLAYITVPELDADYGQEAYDFVRDATEDRDLVARILGKVSTGTGQALNVVLTPKGGSGISLNERVVSEGLGYVEKGWVKKWEREAREGKVGGPKGRATVLGSLVERMEDAKRGRVNLWRYGDFTEDD
ncbi:hypothetical protein HK097_004281 [Rhizophlyctis rosea]|uniref:Endonuclease LCL3 n=1 Tax=Rhizophlyctis rosea TaxID=64517 RepID=A0AAD5X2T9_9FUNG|nr:hypothetical protein HK097_004281 [Rhizophlyctis rosea]